MVVSMTQMRLHAIFFLLTVFYIFLLVKIIDCKSAIVRTKQTTEYEIRKNDSQFQGKQYSIPMNECLTRCGHLMYEQRSTSEHTKTFNAFKMICDIRFGGCWMCRRQ